MKSELVKFEQKMLAQNNSKSGKKQQRRNQDIGRNIYNTVSHTTANSSCDINNSPQIRQISPVVRMKRGIDEEFEKIETPTK